MRIQVPKAKSFQSPASSTYFRPSRPFQVEAQPALERALPVAPSGQDLIDSSRIRLQLGEALPADPPLPGSATMGDSGVAQLQGGGFLKRLGSMLFSPKISSPFSPLNYVPKQNYHVGYPELTAEELKKLRSSKDTLVYRGVADKYAHHAPLAPQYRGKSKAELEHVEEEATTSEEAKRHAGSETPFGVSVAKSPSATLGYGGIGGLMIQVIDTKGMKSTSKGDPALTELVYKNRINEDRVQGVISPDELKKHLDAEKDTPEGKAKRDEIEKMKKRYGLK